MTNANSVAWAITGTFDGESITLEAYADRYQNIGRVAILLYVLNEDGTRELFSGLSINAPHILLMDEDRQFILHHDVTDDTLDMVIDAGLIEEDPDMDVKIGMAVTQVYSLTDKALDWATAHAPA